MQRKFANMIAGFDKKSTLAIFVTILVTLIFLFFQVLPITIQSYDIAYNNSHLVQLTTRVSASGGREFYNLSYSTSGLGKSELPAAILSTFDIGTHYEASYTTLSLSSLKASSKSSVTLNLPVINSSCYDALNFNSAFGWSMGYNNEYAIQANYSGTDYAKSEQSPVIGPSTISVLMGGVPMWPNGGSGILFPPELNYMFGLEANGSGLVNGKVTFSEYRSNEGFVQMMSSSYLNWNTNYLQNLTVADDSSNQFYVFLNSTRVMLTGSRDYYPILGTMGLYDSGGSMNFQSVEVRSLLGDFFALPKNYCNSLIVFPLIPTSQELQFISSTSMSFGIVEAVAQDSQISSNLVMFTGANISILNNFSSSDLLLVAECECNTTNQSIQIINALPLFMTGGNSSRFYIPAKI